MKAYRIVVRDRRTPAPMIWAAEMAHDTRVVEYARDRLSASAHLVGIEVWAGARRLCRFGEPVLAAA